MSLQLSFDIKNWLFGISFAKYTMLVSIGPFGLWFNNEKKRWKDAEAYYNAQLAEYEKKKEQPSEESKEK